MPLDARRVPPFPLDVLPEWVRGWVEAEAEATQTPTALAASVALGTLSIAATRAGIRSEPRPGWIELPNFFILAVLGSGERKSAVVRDGTAPLVAWEREAFRSLGDHVARARGRQDELQEKYDKAKRDAAKGKALTVEVEDLRVQLDRAQPPALPRLFADDITPERIGSLLHEQRGVFAVISTEGGLFETIAGRYADGVPNLDLILKSFTGDTVRVDRGSRPAVSIDCPALSLLLAAQPEVLAGLARKPGFRGRGLVARFLFVVPGSLVGRRKVGAPSVPVAVSERYAARLGDLLGEPGFLPAGGPAEQVLRFDPDARARLLALEGAIEPRLGPGGDLHPIADWAGKYVGAVVRLAGLLHFAEEPTTLAIDAATFQRAEQMGEFFLAHALAAFDAMGTDPALEAARQVLGYARAKGLRRIGRHALFNLVRGAASLRTAEDLDRAVDALEAHGWVRLVATPRQGGPGRPEGPTIEFHPEASVRKPQNPHTPPFDASSADCADGFPGGL